MGTIEYVLKEFKVASKAAEFLQAALDGVRYDRGLLEKAKAAAKGGALNLKDAKAIWEDASGDDGVGATERATIEYVLKEFKVARKSQRGTPPRTILTRTMMAGPRRRTREPGPRRL